MTKKNPPTISDVAHKAGVSTATVSRVLNGTASVFEETARRVREAVAALSYTPMPAARTLAGKRTQTLGLVIHVIWGAFFVPLLRGIESAARQAGYNLLIQAGGLQTDLALGVHNTDGLLVFVSALDDTTLSQLVAAGLPLVQMYAPHCGVPGIPAVTVDNGHGAELAMSHLVKGHNRKRIAFLTGPDDEADALERYQGYRNWLEGCGLAYDPALVVQGGFNQALGQKSTSELIARGVSFDAIFAADDQSATGALAALNSAGLIVGKDVSLIGFDDVAFAAYLNPPLTTVHAPTEAVGNTAVQKLVKLIQGEDVENLTCLPTSLHVRSSCGCNNPK